METILVAVVIGVCTLLASSMIYLFLWNVFRVYFTKYMNKYFEYDKEARETSITVIERMLEKTLVALETMCKLENNNPVKEKKSEE